MFGHGSRIALADNDRSVRPVIRLLLCAFALSLSACAPANDMGHCNVVATRTVAFSAAAAEDEIIIRAIGPTCHNAVGLYTVHGGDGHPMHAWSAPLSRAFGQLSENGDAEETQAFLQRWADETELATTQSSPEWSALIQGQSTLDQLTYEDIRARDLPMLCHYSGTGRQACVFFEPAAGGAGHLYDRDVAVEENTQ
jgi:hypothetical protein